MADGSCFQCYYADHLLKMAIYSTKHVYYAFMIQVYATFTECSQQDTCCHGNSLLLRTSSCRQVEQSLYKVQTLCSFSCILPSCASIFGVFTVWIFITYFTLYFQYFLFCVLLYLHTWRSRHCIVNLCMSSTGMMFCFQMEKKLI